MEAVGRSVYDKRVEGDQEEAELTEVPGRC